MPTRIDTKADSVSLVVPAEIAAILGRPPVTRFELRGAYDQLFADLAAEWQPETTSEWLLVRDLADHSWNVLRLRRAIIDVLDGSIRPALQGLLRSVDPTRVLDPQHVLELTRPSNGHQHLANTLMTEHGLDLDAALGEAFLLRCNELEKLDRLLVSAETRRNATIRTFHDYRNMQLARRSLIDATATTVDPAA